MKQAIAAAMKSPWGQAFAARGMRALQNGEVSPEEAAQNYKALVGEDVNSDPTAQAQPPSSLAIGVNPVPNGPLDLNAAMSPEQIQQKMEQVPVEKGRMNRLSQDQDLKNTRSSSMYTVAAPGLSQRSMQQAEGIFQRQKLDQNGQPMYEPALNQDGSIKMSLGRPVSDQTRPVYNPNDLSIDPNHPIQRQEQGLADLRNLAGQTAEGYKKKDNVDLSGLLAAADWMNAQRGVKSNLVGSYQKPNPKEDTDQILAYANKLQQENGDINKQILENEKLQRGGTDTNSLLQALALKNLSQTGQQGADRAQIAQDRMDWMTHQRTLQRLAQDKPSQAALGTYNALGGALSVLTNADKVNPQLLDDVQQQIRTAIKAGAGNGSSGVDERAKTYVNSIGLNWDRVKQFVTGSPDNIAKDDNLLMHLKQVATIEQQNMQTAYARRLDAISRGNGWLYNEDSPRYNQMYSQSLQDALAGYKGQLPSAGPTPIAGGRAATKAGVQKTMGPTVNGGGTAEIKVISPDGKIGKIPASQKDAALAKGYKLR